MIAANTFCWMIETEPACCFKYTGANCRKASATLGIVLQRRYFDFAASAVSFPPSSPGYLSNILLMVSRELASAVSVKCK